MESFVAFLRDNWKFLVEISIPLVSLIVLCFVKKTKITISSSLWSDLIVKLPVWIAAAEDLIGIGHGEQKLKYVLTCSVDFLSASLGLDEKTILSRYGNKIIDVIESILSTPQKKGDQ